MLHQQAAHLNTTVLTLGRPSNFTVASWMYLAFGRRLFLARELSRRCFQGAADMLPRAAAAGGLCR